VRAEGNEGAGIPSTMLSRLTSGPHRLIGIEYRARIERHQASPPPAHRTAAKAGTANRQSPTPPSAAAESLTDNSALI
jgi:hypothetical protein